MDGVFIDDAGIRKMLNELPDAALNKVMRPVISKATTVVRRAARKNAPVKSGELKKSIIRKTKTYRKSNTVVGLVGPGSGMKPHAHLLETGTAERTQKTTGRRTGKGPATHFLQKSLDENKTAIQEAMRAEVGKQIEKQAKKLANQK